MLIYLAARVCHGDYQSESWQPYHILHAHEQAVDRPHLTAGLFTRVYANVHIHTDCPLSPLLPSLCTSVGRNVLLLCFLDGDGGEISKMPLHFHPDKARPSIYSMYWTLLPPSGGYPHTNKGAVISYSKHVLVAGREGHSQGRAQMRIFTFKGYNLHWSPEFLCCWQMESAAHVSHVPYLCVHGITQSRLRLSCFFCTKEVPFPT